MSYLPTLGLWEQSLAGGEPRRLAVADVSYLQPDIARATARSSRAACRCSSISGDTRRKGPRQKTSGTPSASRARPGRCRRRRSVQAIARSRSCRTVAAMPTSGSPTPASGELRQITYEREPGVAMGVPIWSPDGKVDRLRFVPRQHRAGLRRVARESRMEATCETSPRTDSVSPGRPTRRRIYYSDSGVRVQGPRLRRYGGARSPGSDPQRDRVSRRHDVFHGRPDADRRQPGVRDPCGYSRRTRPSRVLATHSTEPRAAVADRSIRRSRRMEPGWRCRSPTA